MKCFLLLGSMYYICSGSAGDHFRVLLIFNRQHAALFNYESTKNEEYHHRYSLFYCWRTFNIHTSKRHQKVWFIQGAQRISFIFKHLPENGRDFKYSMPVYLPQKP